jgi:hypothetical protein
VSLNEHPADRPVIIEGGLDLPDVNIAVEDQKMADWTLRLQQPSDNPDCKQHREHDYHGNLQSAISAFTGWGNRGFVKSKLHNFINSHVTPP